MLKLRSPFQATFEGTALATFTTFQSLVCLVRALFAFARGGRPEQHPRMQRLCRHGCEFADVQCLSSRRSTSFCYESPALVRRDESRGQLAAARWFRSEGGWTKLARVCTADLAGHILSGEVNLNWRHSQDRPSAWVDLR